ncbi:MULTISPECIES: TonB-dependent receptor [Sphingomonas]|uniref:TonB-dependent receptor n=2 Tax=Sphingomonas hankookensis TaxID=563996 RepID=A0ABR5YFL4_9SPHN|nr:MULTISPECIES: TonB-dependent receptor [Sphingomonas]KZE17115.1 TonB-dependent receptor [Sphingomonas hankookensis]RSV20121.1 TonB-dependent receptor [Sphingomonas sp. ABOLH]WCP71745.1 TonB-dependent receptor [Sphingomonas hankookensis]
MVAISMRTSLRHGAALSALIVSTIAGPAFAQSTVTADEPAAQPATVPTTTAAQTDDETIVVTGSLLRRADAETPSPVTVVTTESLDRRGLATIQDGLQTLSSNNGPALTNSFTANGAFAGGASAVSLRGLSSNSTLVLFDGLRGAYYPLADDGTRNFVDLNTIPDDIVQEVQVLRDGASSLYGADAVAGVVNIITKKQFKGVGGRAEAGISERGDASQYRMSLTAGIGDLSDDGFNIYGSGFYYRSEALRAANRRYPYNTDDLRQVCYEGNCGANGVLNGTEADGNTGGFEITTPFAVRPRDPITGAAIPGVSSRYQYLNGCQGLPTAQLSTAELALAQNAAAPANGVVCQEDLTLLYGNIAPRIERFGGSARATAKFGDNGEAYGEFNFLQTNTFYEGLPATIRGNAPAGFYFPRYSTSANIAAYGNNTILQLPVYICQSGVNCSTAADRVLNPNNPFAAQNQTAAIIGRIPNLREQNETRTRAYRAALGVTGDITDNVSYNVGATAMHIDLQTRANGYVRIQNLLNAVNTGSYNFINPQANSQAVLDQIAPENINNATSDLYQAQASVQTSLFELPGGPLAIGVGTAIRYEAVDAPSANSDINGPTQRYFRLNGFAAKGNRTVYSAYAELEAPIVDQFLINASGRYDKYSSGQDNFSPKIGAKFTPIRQLVVRGTWSKGFRIPSFGEANATFPTTGYVSATQGIYNDAFLSQYGCSLATYTRCPSYISAATYGQTSISNPDLKAEKSRSYTAGILFEPIRNVSFTVDYYNIKKTDAITTANNAPAIAAYYAGQAIPAGYTVIPDAVDINNPTARPRIAFVQSPFINANTIKSEGIDFGINANYRFNDDLRVSSNLEASYILELSTTFPDGSKERYEGTLGNYNLTAGSGTPQWRGTWLNTVEFRDVLVSATVNYFDGYDLSAEDQTGPGTAGDCGLSDGTIPCKVSDYITVDLNTSFKVNDRFTFYVNAINLFDRLPPLDNVTYGAHLYNPVQGGLGILGRYFRAGVKVGL